MTRSEYWKLKLDKFNLKLAHNSRSDSVTVSKDNIECNQVVVWNANQYQVLKGIIFEEEYK